MCKKQLSSIKHNLIFFKLISTIRILLQSTTKKVQRHLYSHGDMQVTVLYWASPRSTNTLIFLFSCLFKYHFDGWLSYSPVYSILAQVAQADGYHLCSCLLCIITCLLNQECMNTGSYTYIHNTIFMHKYYIIELWFPTN